MILHGVLLKEYFPFIEVSYSHAPFLCFPLWVCVHARDYYTTHEKNTALEQSTGSKNIPC